MLEWCLSHNVLVNQGGNGQNMTFFEDAFPIAKWGMFHCHVSLPECHIYFHRSRYFLPQHNADSNPTTDSTKHLRKHVQHTKPFSFFLCHLPITSFNSFFPLPTRCSCRRRLLLRQWQSVKHSSESYPNTTKQHHLLRNLVKKRTVKVAQAYHAMVTTSHEVHILSTRKIHRNFLMTEWL